MDMDFLSSCHAAGAVRRRHLRTAKVLVVLSIKRILLGTKKVVILGFGVRRLLLRLGPTTSAKGLHSRLHLLKLKPLQAMLQSCTKFRVFNILLLLCVVNFLLYRSFFHQRVASGGTSIMTMDLNATAHASRRYNSSGRSSGRSSVRTTTPTTTTRTTTLSVKDSAAGIDVNTRNPSNAGGDNSTSRQSEGSLPVVQGPAPLLESRGKVVKPLANVKAPWAPDNTTTLCPLVPPKLGKKAVHRTFVRRRLGRQLASLKERAVGPLATYQVAPSFEEVVKLNNGLEPGGHFHPPDCRARSRVAVVIPYRDREQHLRILVHNLHPMLMRQQLDYAIIVVELAQPTEFNRAMLMNIGAVEALGLWDFQCFIFHDVDLVPENDRNLYSCPEMPRHMSVAVDKFGYKLPYQALFGGVTALSREHFYALNGYSNKYFGWGGEDDDMAARVNGNKLKITRYSLDVARYRMIKHNRDFRNDPNPKRFELLNKWESRQDQDGLNTLQYTVQKVEFRPGYTWFLVNIDKDAILKS
ncbi:beta-1,4-galactosyltransferase 1-like isoform X2 [Pomacea canaliculata]|uniref:beta-1,4-galactosyltransferase 1-like isoform X2 n=1 Tax=Pomacea canaliculata TaxID=400727 RepID=UPI000D73A205|nr:beta-1,4-galactosyltransferase 1-like isoform X2 [Pomacea canaliculata]